MVIGLQESTTITADSLVLCGVATLSPKVTFDRQNIPEKSAKSLIF